MKHKSIYIAVVGILLVLASCGTIRYDRTSDFKQIASPTELNGQYLNYRDVTEYGTLLSRLNIAAINVDFVTLDFLNDNTLTISYRNDSSQVVDTLHGEMKKNYFEIYFKKKNIMAGVYTNVEINRIRLGINKKDGMLYIKHLTGEAKSVLVVGFDSFGDENKYTYKKASAYSDYLPFEKEGKWGYYNNENTIAIVPAFEYARIYEQGAARVKIDGKWGLIDKNAKWLTTAQYDYIGSLLDGRRDAILNKERGYIDNQMQFRRYSAQKNNR